MAKNIRRIEEGLTADIERRRKESKDRAKRMTEKRRAWENEHVVLADLLYGAEVFMILAVMFALICRAFIGGL